MAILGVLAVVVLVAINPAEQLARTRDTGRVSSVTQMGHAVAAYYTSHNASYPTASSWASDLSTSGELSTVPSGITYATAVGCAAGNNQVSSNWCYLSGTDTVVYAGLESKSYRTKCGASGTTAAWVLYSAVMGRGGVVCGTEPTAGGGYTFVN